MTSHFTASPISRKAVENRKASLNLGAALLALTFIWSGQANAAPGYPEWDGSVSSDWTDGGNWVGDAAPSLSGTFAIVAPSGSMTAPVLDGKAGEVNMLFLGSTDLGKLSIINGGQLTGLNVTVGNSTNNYQSGLENERGQILVQGSGSTLTTDFLTVGYYGSGVVEVLDGGKLLLGSATSIAAVAGSEGSIKLAGPGSRLEGAGLSIGGDGSGTFEVSGGATAQTSSGTFGVNVGSSGSGTISGAGTNWTVTGTTLTVGGSGQGDLLISDGAVVSSADRVNIGLQTGGSGTLAVAGTGSSLTATTEFFIGQNGIGEANVTDGATASGAKVILGFSGASAGTLIVDGANSLVKGTSYVMIGYGNTGVATISNGGTLKADGARGITIGFEAGSNGVLNIGAASGDTATAAGYIDAVNGIKFGDGAGRLVLNHTNSDYQLAAPLVGAGAVDVLAGTTIFTGNSSQFSGSFRVDGGKAVLAGETNAINAAVNAGGTLQIGNGGTTGSLNGDIVNDGVLIFDRSNDASYAGKISGHGLMRKAGAGTTALSGDSGSFAGSTSIESGKLLLTGTLNGDISIDAAGTLQIGDGVNDGHLLANAVNNGTLIFNQAADYDYAGALWGNGGLVKKGAGVLLLSGDYRYTGSTIVENGLVRLSSQLDTNTDLVVDGGTFDLGGRDQEVAGLG